MFEAFARRRGPWLALAPPILMGFALLAVPTPGQTQTIRGVSLSVEAFRFNYEEENNFELTSEDPFLRLGIDYTLGLGSGWFMRIGGSYAEGEAELAVAGFGTASDVDQRFWEARVELGRDMALEGTLSIAPYFGLRYRHWEDDSTGVITSGGAFGFDRRVDHLILPLGVTAFWALGDAWTVSARGEVSVLLYGHEKGKLSSLPGISFDLSNEFVSGRGLAGELLLRKRLTGWLSLALGPYVRYWDIDDSDPDPVVPLIVPANETVEAGVVFKIIFGAI